MTRLYQIVMTILESGQDLSVGEKIIAKNVIASFEKRFKDATGEDPVPNIDTLQLIALELEEYGFRLCIVDSWRDEVWELINKTLLEKGYRPWFGRRR